MKRQVKVKTPFNRAYQILAAGIITEIQIRTLRKQISNRWGGEAWNEAERWNLYGLFEDCRLDLTKEQQTKGIKWLLKTHFKLNGAQRKSSKLTQDHLNVILNFSHFTFEGLRSTSASGIGLHRADPIYRTHAKNGDYFDYIVNPSFFGADVEYQEVRTNPRMVPYKNRGAK